MATGIVKGEAELLRVALDPEGRVTEDVAARLPGRGAWVSADRQLVDQAVKKRLFNRAFERAVECPDDLSDRFAAQLEARALSLLGLARRAGRLAIGSDAVRQALQSGAAPAWRVEASDAAPDGRGKLDRLAAALHPGLPVAACFSAETLSAALGQGNVVHAALAAGPEATQFATVMGKLAGFRSLDPAGASAENG